MRAVRATFSAYQRFTSPLALQHQYGNMVRATAVVEALCLRGFSTTAEHRRIGPDHHCTFCGTTFPTHVIEGRIWPRECAACHNTSYKNPLPVAVTLVPVAVNPTNSSFTPGAVLIQRNIAPRKGYWGLPGGFVDYQENWRHAALREVREETGIDINESTPLLSGLRPIQQCPTDQEDFTAEIEALGLSSEGAARVACFAVHNTPILHNIIIFGVLRGWLPQATVNTSFANEEVSAVKVVTEADLKENEFAFPMHSIILKQFFRQVKPQPAFAGWREKEQGLRAPKYVLQDREFKRC